MIFAAYIVSFVKSYLASPDLAKARENNKHIY